MQRTPGGLPCGMPGMGLLIDGAMQHAPQKSLHCILHLCKLIFLAHCVVARFFGYGRHYVA